MVNTLFFLFNQVNGKVNEYETTLNNLFNCFTFFDDAYFFNRLVKVYKKLKG
jgi:hypothetical protein